MTQIEREKYETNSNVQVIATQLADHAKNYFLTIKGS